jgi:SAM-dependent methyltransferase
LFEKYKINPRFVDIGCGNGLLVYLLSLEGYTGYGIDLTKRKIWDKLAPLENSTDIKLLQQLEITRDSTFPDTNFLIGNHADELTPWIPVFAARSNANFILIPCCTFDFSCRFSKVYTRDGKKIGKYASYVEYIKSIATKIGFIVEVEYLRIPSTKNVCIVGWMNENVDKSVAEDMVQGLDVCTRSV